MAVQTPVSGVSLLRSLNIRPKYAGFDPMAYALDRSSEDIDPILGTYHKNMTWLIDPMCEMFGKSWNTLRRELDKLCRLVWEDPDSRALYISYAGIDVTERPSVNEFITDMANYIWRQNNLLPL